MHSATDEYQFAKQDRISQNRRFVPDSDLPPATSLTSWISGYSRVIVNCLVQYLKDCASECSPRKDVERRPAGNRGYPIQRSWASLHSLGDRVVSCKLVCPASHDLSVFWGPCLDAWDVMLQINRTRVHCYAAKTPHHLSALACFMASRHSSCDTGRKAQCA